MTLYKWGCEIYLDMAFLDLHGRAARIFYNNIVYLTMGLLGALVCAALNAEYGAGVRFDQCALSGTPAADGCAPFAAGAAGDEQKEQQQQLFNISLATSIVNGLFFALSVLTQFNRFESLRSMMIKGQMALSLVNVGLFSGLVGWFNATDHDDLLSEANLENNIYFLDYNPFVVAVAGVTLGVLDTVLFNILDYTVFKDRCKADAEQSGCCA